MVFIQIFGQIVSIRATKFSNTNLEESRHFKREKKSVLVDMRRSKAPLLKLPNNKIIQEPYAISTSTSTSALLHKTIGYNRLAHKIAIANLGRPVKRKIN